MKTFSLALVIFATLSSFSWGQTKNRGRSMSWSHTPVRIASKSLSTGRRPKVSSSGIRLCPVFTVSWSTLLKENIPILPSTFNAAAVADLGPRLMNEAQAGRYVADALESTPGPLMLLRERSLLKAYTSVELARYPDEAKTKADGTRIYWVTDR